MDYMVLFYAHRPAWCTMTLIVITVIDFALFDENLLLC